MAGGLEKREVLLLLPDQIRRLPADLVAVIGMVLLTDLAVILPVIRETPIRVLLGLPFVIFVPGYAFIAALFPEQGASPVDDEAEESERGRGIDGIERVALSFGLSIAIVPLLGLVLNFTPWGIRLRPILLTVSGFTLLSTWVAARRRQALPEEERFRVPYRSWLAAGRAELFEPESRTDAALNVLLALSVILAVASVGYAVAVPKQGEAFTELYLLTRDDGGDLVADGYPTEMVRGEPSSLVLGIGNHEHREVDYTVVSLLQEVEITGNLSPSVNDTSGNSTLDVTVHDERELQRYSVSLAHNRTWIRDHEVSPPITGERLRLLYLLYNDTVPPEPSVENAYREVHLWVNVSAPGQ